MANYKIAQTYAESGADSSLMGLIQFNMGDLLSIQGLYGEALERYEAAESLYKPIPKSKYCVLVLWEGCICYCNCLIVHSKVFIEG